MKTVNKARIVTFVIIWIVVGIIVLLMRITPSQAVIDATKNVNIANQEYLDHCKNSDREACINGMDYLRDYCAKNANDFLYGRYLTYCQDPALKVN